MPPCCAGLRRDAGEEETPHHAAPLCPVTTEWRTPLRCAGLPRDAGRHQLETSLDSLVQNDRSPELQENVGNNVESSQWPLTMSCENVEWEVEGEAEKEEEMESQKDKAPKEAKKRKEMQPRSNPNKINDNRQQTLQATTLQQMRRTAVIMQLLLGGLILRRLEMLLLK